ncbi:MAG: hypothetical protein QNK05_09220 [Myxococcota bacterium]|nr:hypothetical protein [Myxococcota bacterium]
MPLLLLALAALAALPAAAEPPAVLAYQGQLLDAAGDAPVAPTIRVRIFPSLDGESALFEEEHVAVPVAADGRFELAIGSGTPLVGVLEPALFDGSDRFLELVVDGEVLAPRQRIGSAAFALRSSEASKVRGVPVREVVDGAGQVLGTLLSSEGGFGDFKATLPTPAYSYQVVTPSGRYFRVDTAGNIGDRRIAVYVSSDCTGPPLLSRVDAGRILRLRFGDGTTEFLFVPEGPVLDDVDLGSSTGAFFPDRCTLLQGVVGDDLIAAEPLPDDLGFSFPLTAPITTRPR